jgi:uncharacterized protein involved in exopolysaccharide biosynthesis
MSDVRSNNDNLRRAFALANIVLRHRWIVIMLPILAGAVSVTRSFAQKRSFTTRATFMTQGATRPAASNLLAAQFGINFGSGGDPTLGPDFYADLLSSRPVLERTVRATYSVPAVDSATSRTLVQIYGGVEDAIQAVRGGISTSVSPRTGVVSLSVRSRSPALAQQIAEELLRQLDDFNKQRRKSRVSAERQFTEARLKEAAIQLRTTEDTLQAFYTRNRDFATSPQLKFREERLSRDVALRQQLYGSLAQSYEQAKIDEVRDTPVITVLEEPMMPRVGDSRHTVDRGLLAVALGLLLAIALALVLDSAKTARLEKVDELDEFKALGRQFLYEVRNPLTTARRVLS